MLAAFGYVISGVQGRRVLTSLLYVVVNHASTHKHCTLVLNVYLLVDTLVLPAALAYACNCYHAVHAPALTSKETDIMMEGAGGAGRSEGCLQAG